MGSGDHSSAGNRNLRSLYTGAKHTRRGLERRRANVLFNHVKKPSQSQCRRSFIMFGLLSLSFLWNVCPRVAFPLRRSLLARIYRTDRCFSRARAFKFKPFTFHFSHSMLLGSIATVFCRLIYLSSRRWNCARSSSWRSHGPRLAGRKAGQKLVIHEHVKQWVKE